MKYAKLYVLHGWQNNAFVLRTQVALQNTVVVLRNSGCIQPRHLSGHTYVVYRTQTKRTSLKYGKLYVLSGQYNRSAEEHSSCIQPKHHSWHTAFHISQSVCFAIAVFNHYHSGQICTQGQSSVKPSLIGGKRAWFDRRFKNHLLL